MRYWIGPVAAVAVLGILAATSEAPAQQPGSACRPRDEMMAYLSHDFGEAPRVQALDASGAIMEITVAADGGYSVILTTPDGMSCMIRSGTYFGKAVEPARVP